MAPHAEQSRPAFFEALVGHVYDGYYSHPTVVARLGLDPSPLHPRGHRIETALLQTGDEVRMGAAKLEYKVDYTST